MVLKKRHAVVEEEKAPKKRRKEAKEVDSYVSKKSKKSKARVREESPSEEEEVIEEVHDGNKMISPPWPEADMLELFRRMEALVPSDDSLSYGSREGHLEWEEIAFNQYSAKECKDVWQEVRQRVRKFRLLKEVISDARVWLRKPWTNFNKPGQSQHPDMPKRPLSSYMLYFMDKRNKVSASHPKLDVTSLSKVVAESYNKLNPEKLKKYQQKAAALQEEYKAKMKKFYEDHPEYVAYKESTSRRAKSDAYGGMTKPRPPWKIFVDERLAKRSNDPGFNKNDATLEARELFRKLSDEKKVIWIKWAMDEESKYLEAVKLRKAEDPEFEPPPHKPVLSKSDLALKERASGKPAKPPSSAYSLFSTHMLASNPKIKALVPKFRMKEIAVEWAKLSDADKQEYQKELESRKEQYKLEYAAFLESLPDKDRHEELLKTQTSKSLLKLDKDVVNNGKTAKVVKPKTSPKRVVEKPVRKYFPNEPVQPPGNSYDLFVESFVADTKLAESEAPRFWDMLPASDKSKFQRKLKELKDKYIKDYKKFLKSLDEDEVAKYNELQKRNKALEEAADAKADENSDDDEEEEDDDDSDEDEADSSEEENVASNRADEENDDDSDEDEPEEKKLASSSSSSSSSDSSDSSSSSEDSDSSSDESDNQDRKVNQKSVLKGEDTDSDSSDD